MRDMKRLSVLLANNEEGEEKHNRDRDPRDVSKTLQRTKASSVPHWSWKLTNMSRNDWSSINHMGPLGLAAIVVALFLCVALAHILTSFRHRKSQQKVRSLSVQTQEWSQETFWAFSVRPRWRVRSTQQRSFHEHRFSVAYLDKRKIKSVHCQISDGYAAG